MVEEGWRYYGFGPRSPTRSRECFDALDAPFIRVTPPTAHDYARPREGYLPQPSGAWKAHQFVSLIREDPGDCASLDKGT